MDQHQIDGITSGLKTKSDKIRALNAAGVSRADIGRHLGIRYQHVRNVLVSDAALATGVAAHPSAATEPLPATDDRPTKTLTIEDAKRGLAAHFGVNPDAIEIIIRG